MEEDDNVTLSYDEFHDEYLILNSLKTLSSINPQMNLEIDSQFTSVSTKYLN